LSAATVGTWTGPAGSVLPGSGEPPRRGRPPGQARPCLRIVRRLFAALDDRAGVVAHRSAVFERPEWTLAGWDAARAKLVDVEARMVSVLDELDLTALVTSIEGLSAAGAAARLAQTGDLARFRCAGRGQARQPS
jgi:hypothetical protein